MTRQPDPAEQLVDALLAFTAPITQIIEQMARSPRGVSVEQLRQLLAETVAPLEGDLGAAAAIVEAATDAITTEIFLVPHQRSPRRRPDCS